MLLSFEEMLYRKLGISLCLRKWNIKRRSKQIQEALGRQHFIKDTLNETYGLNYTTKKALSPYK